MRKTTTLALLTGLVAVLAPISLLAPQAQAATAASPKVAAVTAAAVKAAAVKAAAVKAAAVTAAALPGGRSTYVVTMMGGVNGAMYSKLSMYLFATNGTVTQRYWYWRQDMISGFSNAARWKVYTGYTTSGCRYACPVRTPLGFQPGTSPKSISGTWRTDSNGNLAVRWTATAHEGWRLNSSQAGFTTMTVMTAYSTGAIQRGWGFGSRASASQGASMAAVHASRQLLGPLAINYYGVRTKVYPVQSFYFPYYSECVGGRCLQSNQNTAADKRTWYNSYLAGNPATDGRKVYWNSENGSVAQWENPGTVCIGYGGGHTNAVLQVLDDNGRFLGFVGAEASMDRRNYLQDEVGAWVGVLQPMLATISPYL